MQTDQPSIPISVGKHYRDKRGNLVRVEALTDLDQVILSFLCGERWFRAEPIPMTETRDWVLADPDEKVFHSPATLLSHLPDEPPTREEVQDLADHISKQIPGYRVRPSEGSYYAVISIYKTGEPLCVATWANGWHISAEEGFPPSVRETIEASTSPSATLLSHLADESPLPSPTGVQAEIAANPPRFNLGQVVIVDNSAWCRHQGIVTGLNYSYFPTTKTRGWEYSVVPDGELVEDIFQEGHVFPALEGVKA